jgi:hypothetical protein
MIEIRNAIIKSATLSSEDHGILSSYLHLDYGGMGQGFGGYCLFNPNFKSKAAAGLWIWRCLEIADVTEWSKLPGRTIRAQGDVNKIHRIGHILKDVWFDPRDEFATLIARD